MSARVSPCARSPCPIAADDDASAAASPWARPLPWARPSPERKPLLHRTTQADRMAPRNRIVHQRNSAILPVYPAAEPSVDLPWGREAWKRTEEKGRRAAALRPAAARAPNQGCSQANPNLCWKLARAKAGWFAAATLAAAALAPGVQLVVATRPLRRVALYLNWRLINPSDSTGSDLACSWIVLLK